MEYAADVHYVPSLSVAWTLASTFAPLLSKKNFTH